MMLLYRNERGRMPTIKKQPRQPAKNKLRTLLPKSAKTVTWEGTKFVALPDQDIDAWLEDLVDGIEATLSMHDVSPRLSQADIKKRYDME